MQTRQGFVLGFKKNVFAEITEETAMGYENADEHAYLKRILENAPDGVFTIDTEMNIRYVNPAFCRMLDFSREHLIGSSITHYLGDLNILGICMTEVQRNGHCNDQETIFKRADGSMVHISKNVQAIYDDSHTIREILVTIRDLTEIHGLNRRLEQTLAERQKSNQTLQQTLDQLRDAQKQLVQSEKMAALGSLVAGMAHEINTPVGIGVTSASSIREETQKIAQRFSAGTMKRSELDQFLRHTEQACEILHSNLRRAADLVGSFKQVAADQTSDDCRTIDLHDYLDEVLLSLRPGLKQTRLTVTNSSPSGLSMFINPGALYQVVSNLVMNSIVHGFPTGSEGNISLSARAQDDRVIIEYRDDGAGIPAEHLGRIFDPFFTTRRGQGGTGLGLNIVYNLITATLNGKITVDSTPGRGTCFVIEVPAQQKEAA
jgi:PAS domain S-box-containing protein